MFSCMGSQLDMGDRDSERKALRKVHCTTQQLYNKNEARNNNSAETKMLRIWLYST